MVYLEKIEYFCSVKRSILVLTDEQRVFVTKKQHELIQLLTEAAENDGILGPSQQIRFTLEIVTLDPVVAENNAGIMELPWTDVLSEDDFVTAADGKPMGKRTYFALWRQYYFGLQGESKGISLGQMVSMGKKILRRDTRGFGAACLDLTVIVMRKKGIEMPD